MKDITHAEPWLREELTALMRRINSKSDVDTGLCFDDARMIAAKLKSRADQLLSHQQGLTMTSSTQQNEDKVSKLVSDVDFCLQELEVETNFADWSELKRKVRRLHSIADALDRLQWMDDTLLIAESTQDGVGNYDIDGMSFEKFSGVFSAGAKNPSHPESPPSQS